MEATGGSGGVDPSGAEGQARHGLANGGDDGVVSSAPLLEARSLGVAFGGLKAIDGVDLAVRSGEVCGLVGPNGAGKTTLFDCLSGVRRPTSGTVHLHGADVTRRSATWRARHGVRRTFQRQQVFGRMTVEENVLVALEWRGGGGGMAADALRLPGRVAAERRRRAAVAEVVERCGLADVRNVPAGRLPIGTARMVELARALADGPEVLMVDEPTSGLDEAEAARVADVVRQARTDLGCAVVLVEHDVEFVLAVSDRLVVLDQGRVIADGAPGTVRDDPTVRAVYLGSPVP